MSRIALTFEDDNGNVNPYNPCDDFEQWFAFDPVRAGKTLAVLAAVADYSPDLPPEDQLRLHDEAVNEICRENVTGFFRKYSY